MKPVNDEMIVTLIQNAQKGQEAFEQLVRQYQHDVFRIIRVYTQNDSDAEDLAQETWIKVYRSIRKLRPPYHLESWLKTIAVNTAKDWLKSRAHRESEATDEIAPRQLWGSAMSAYQRQELIQRIREAIDSLPKQNREVVYDFYICGYSAAQIGQRLRIPVTTVNYRLKEARKELREEFSTMVAMSRIQEQFAPDRVVQHVMERIGSLPTPVPKGNIIDTIRRLLPKQINPTIVSATLVALIAAGLIWVNRGNFKPSGDGSQKGNRAFAAGVWRKRANMPTARWLPSASAVNGKIYAIGGFVGGRALSTVEAYDPTTDTWTQRADMPTPRSHLSPPVVDGKIYAIGGFGNNGVVLSTVEAYDPQQIHGLKEPICQPQEESSLRA